MRRTCSVGLACGIFRDWTHVFCIGRLILYHQVIISWQIGGETVADFILGGGSKIAADGDCDHEIKRCLLFGRKVKTNLDSRLKSRDITLPKRSSSQGYGFFQWSCMDVRVGLGRKLSAEKLMRLNCGVGEDLRVPWTARRSNQSILKEISPGCSLEGLMLKLKLQCFGHFWRCEELTHLKRPWCWERLRAGGEGDDRG